MEKFNLKWNDYQNNVSKSFRLLRYKDDFCDVTLVGDDFKQVTAHKVILASCSEYFNKILKNNSRHSHPVLCMDGIDFKDIQNVLDYIYNGELKIYQEDIDRFLTVAQQLKLEGIPGKGNNLYDIYSTENTAESSWVESVAELTDLKKTDSRQKIESRQKTESRQERTMISLPPGDFDTIEKVNAKVEESYSKDDSGVFWCHFCSYQRDHKDHIKKHVETHFDGLALNCDQCGKTYRSRDSLRHHQRRFHNTLNNISL